MYEWWRFQRYLIYPKRLKIKISIRLDHTYRSNTQGSRQKKFSSAKLQQYKNGGFQSKLSFIKCVSFYLSHQPDL